MCRSQCQFNVTVEYKLVLTSHLVHERKNDEASWPRHFHKSFRPVVKRFSSCYQSTWFLQISQMIDSFSCSSHIAASVSRPITWKLLSVPNRQSDLQQPIFYFYGGRGRLHLSNERQLQFAKKFAMISSHSLGEEWDWEVEATVVGRELLPPFLILDRPISLVPNSLIGSKWGLWGKHIKSPIELKDIYVS